MPRLIGDGRGRWGGVKVGVGRRKIRLTENNVKRRYLKKLTFAAGVYMSEAPPLLGICLVW